MMRRRWTCALVMLAAIFAAGCADEDDGGPPPNPVLSLPVDETIALPGLPATTDVVFDSIGIPHVYANDTRAVLFVQGYETAKSRLWELDAFRRVAEGRLSELFGTFTVGMD